MARPRSFKRRKTTATSTTSPDAKRMWLLFVPLILQIALIRLLETTMLQRGAMAPVETLLWTSAPLPFLVLLIGVVTFWLARSRLAHVPAVLPASVATGISALTAVLSYHLAPWWITEWVTPKALEILRWDVTMVLALVSVTLLLLALRGSRVRRPTLLMVHLLVPVLMSLSTAGFGYFLATGSPADWQIFKYAVSNFSMVRELVAGSVKGYHLLLLVAPWFWSALTWSLVSDGGHGYRGSQGVRSSAALALTPVILLLVLVPPVHVTPSVQSGSLHRIVKTAAVDVMGGGAFAWDVDPSGQPDFDATELRFDRTDSTTTPNIVMILMESVRRRSSTPYNPGLPSMPFLDSLAKAGALVEDMSAVISYTNKALIPIYAGIYPSPGRDFVEAEPDGIPAKGLPALLSPFGYESAFFTSATMEFERKDLILKNLGFDYMVGADDLDVTDFHEKAYFGYEDRAAMKPALDWARKVHEEGKPFFLNILTLTSHHPYDVPDSFTRNDYGTPDHELTAYYNSLRYTDDFLREFMTEMSAAGLAENTVYVILGDHGEAFQEHMEKTHGNVVWDEALRVPAVIYGPDLIPSGSRISGARQHIDLLPTIADLLNTTLSAGYLPGRSLFANVSDDRTLYHHSLDDGKTMALRRDSMKFIYSYRHGPTQVFNYIADPDERLDVASRYSDDYLSAVELELLIWRKRAKEAYVQQPEL